MLTLLGFLTGIAGAIIMHLGSRRQQLLRQPLNTSLSLVGGALLFMLSTAFFATTFVMLTAVFVVFTVMMLMWSAIPLLIAFLRYRSTPDNP